MENAMNKHPDVSVLISFASMRSVYETTVEALGFPQVCGHMQCAS
jgi:ATP citrate (pro-S)-lyase